MEAITVTEKKVKRIEWECPSCHNKKGFRDGTWVAICKCGSKMINNNVLWLSEGE